MERKAGKVLSGNELKAVLEFLRAHVPPFSPNKLKARVLEKLVENSEILEIESDSRPFSHKDDQFPNAERETKRIFEGQ